MAAVGCLSGIEGAVFEEFVCGSAAAAEFEKVAFGAAAFDAGGGVLEDAEKGFGFEGLVESAGAEGAEGERAVVGGFDAEHFGRERGKVALPIDAEDAERADLFVLVDEVVGGVCVGDDAGERVVEFADADFAAGGFLTFEDTAEKCGDAVFGDAVE